MTGPARPGDAPAVARILGDWVREMPWMPVVHSRADDLAHAKMLIDRFDVSVVRTRSAVVGFLARDGSEVHALYLAPTARGQGLGKRLLDAAKRRSERLELWAFEANTAARCFYRREGFREVARTDGAENDEKLPDVRLVWTAEAGA